MGVKAHVLPRDGRKFIRSEIPVNSREEAMSVQYEMAPSPRQPLNRQGVRRISGLDVELRVATANVGTMRGRGREVAEMLGRRKVDICGVQEVRFKNNGTRTYGTGEEKYKFWWSGGRDKRAGVGLLVKEELVKNVIEVVRWNERMMKIRMVCGKRVFNIFSAYAPQQGCEESEKEDFREELKDRIGEVPDSEVAILIGDMNAHIGRDRDGYEEVMGKFGMGERNHEGEQMLQMCLQLGMKIWNTWFKKRKEHLITYKSGNVATQIDFIMTRGRVVEARNCKVIPGEECLTQHRLLCADFKIRDMKRPKMKGERRIKVWKLKDPTIRSNFQEKIREREGDMRNGWEDTCKVFMEEAEKICGVTTGRRQRERETWWWCEEVRQAIAEKKKAFKEWHRRKTEESRNAYRMKSRQAMRAVAVAKENAWREWSRNINSAEGRQKMFRMAKQMRKEKKDVVGGIYVKDENGSIKVDEQDVKERWRKYFENLLNEENPYELEGVGMVEGPVEEVREEEVRNAVKKMKNGKAPGPSGFTVDMVKAAGENGVKEITRALRKVQRDGEMPREWGESFTVPIYKGKGDALSCNKYRGVRLLEHGMKIWEKILEERLRKLVKIDESQFGFQKGKSTTDAIFILRQIQEKYAEKKRRLYHVFVDLEKAFDRVPREVIRWALRRQCVPERMISLVMALYVNTRSRVKTGMGVSGEFEIKVGVHQGSALSPLLFVLVMEEATREVREGLWELLYADDLVITAENEEGAIDRFNDWKTGMENRGLKINMEKTKVMITGRAPVRRQERGNYPCSSCGRGVGVNSVLCRGCGKWCHLRCSGLRSVNQAGENYQCPVCVDGGREQGVEERLEFGGEGVEIVDQFSYLGDMMSCEMGAEAAVRARIAAAWKKWREISGLLVNSRIPLISRAKVYCACVRPVMMYGAETWPVTREIERMIRQNDCRMLRYMCQVRWEDRVTDEEVMRRCGVEDVTEVVNRSRLRWYGHVRRREGGHIIRRAMDMAVEGVRPRGRPRKTWKKGIVEVMNKRNLGEGNVLDRREWERLIARPTS